MSHITVILISFRFRGGRRANISINSGLIRFRGYLRGLHAIHIDSLLDLLIEHNYLAKRAFILAGLLVLIHILGFCSIAIFTLLYCISIVLDAASIFILEFDSSFADRFLGLIIDLLSLL